MLVGDINIRLERASDANTIAFGDLIASYGLTQLVSGITHDEGGTLDVVCVRDDQPLPTIDVLDIGLSGYRLLCWKPGRRVYRVRHRLTLRRRSDPGDPSTMRPSEMVF